MQLAREPAPFELLRLDDPAQRVACHARGEVDGDRGTWGEGLGQTQVLVTEPRVLELLVVGDDDADRPPSKSERNEEPGLGAEPLDRLLVDLRIVGERVDTFRAAAFEHASALRTRSLELHADDLVCPLAVGRFDSQRSVGSRQCDGHEPRVDQAP